MTTDTGLPAVLAAIRERPQAMRSQDSWVQLAAAEADNARLLAAVEAVLAAHQPSRRAINGDLCDVHESTRWFSFTEEEGQRVTDCPDCKGVVVQVCRRGELWPCPDYLAISRALTPEAPMTPEPFDLDSYLTRVCRERRGQTVRGAWVEWASGQPDPKPSWLEPWEALSDRDREADMRIGDALSAEYAVLLTAVIDALKGHVQAAGNGPEVVGGLRAVAAGHCDPESAAVTLRGVTGEPESEPVIDVGYLSLPAEVQTAVGARPPARPEPRGRTASDG